MDWFQPCMVPEGQIGSARVERFTVSATEADLSRIQSWGSSVDAVPSGEYVGLYERGTLWMSNTPSEERDHIPPIRRARAMGGRCLVVGLGLGLVTEALLAVPEVTRVTVIERSQDIVDLVAPTLQARWGDLLEVVVADVHDWKPPRGATYSVVWIDIWPYICAENWEEMKKLKRRFARRADWVGVWREASVRQAARREAEEDRQRAAWRAMFRRTAQP